MDGSGGPTSSLRQSGWVGPVAPPAGGWVGLRSSDFIFNTLKPSKLTACLAHGTRLNIGPTHLVLLRWQHTQFDRFIINNLVTATAATVAAHVPAEPLPFERPGYLQFSTVHTHARKPPAPRRSPSTAVLAGPRAGVCAVAIHSQHAGRAHARAASEGLPQAPARSRRTADGGAPGVRTTPERARACGAGGGVSRACRVTRLTRDERARLGGVAAGGVGCARSRRQCTPQLPSRARRGAPP